MSSEGSTLHLLDGVDSRRYLPHVLGATALVIVVPALVVIPLAPFSGIADMLLSALLATGLSVVAGSICSAAWTRRPESSEIVFGDLMLWAWIRRARDERRVAKGLERGGDDDLATLRRLSVVFEARSAHSHGHSGRVARHAERIARELGLPAEEVAKVKTAASVHDVGKVQVPRSILLREGGLSQDERAAVERHVDYGAEKVAAVAGPDVAAMVRHHHERVDGAGYPDGLSGDEIPLGARIIAVADRFDELTCDGGQRSARSEANALDALSERAGNELDPAVVAAFAGYYSGKRAIAGAALAATAPQRLVRWLAATPAAVGTSATPSLVGGVCAAGTLALAGSCLTGLPALDEGSRAGQPASERVERLSGGERASAVDQAADAVERRAGGDRRTGPGGRGGGGTDGGSAPGDRQPAGDGPNADQPQSSPNVTGDAPASSPGTSGPAPISGGGGTGSTPPTPAPNLPSDPVGLPQLPLPETPIDPPQGLDPVLDDVAKALESLPTEQLTAPLTRLP